MYVAHFGLRHRPFRSAPDPGGYYPATAHEETLQQLQQALSDDEGLALLTGEPGTGKTLLAEILLERLGNESPCVFVTNSHLTRRTDLFQAVLYDLGLPYEGRSEQELRLALTDRLLSGLAEGGRTVLIFDEAHHLPPDLLEELRLFGNLETRLGRAVQVVLVAQPPILETLRHADLQALAQRLTVRTMLGRLTRDESADYLLHQLRVAGARPEAIVSGEALDLLARGCGGLPRWINQAAHLALTLTCQAGAGRVDAEGALEALTRLGLEAPAEDDGPSPEPPAPEPEASQPSLTAPPESPEDDAVPHYRWPPGAYLLPAPGPARLSYTPGKSG
jgi:type II secretory pathway predicted ATPase ExeA